MWSPPVYCDVRCALFMSWCIFYVVMYYVCHGIFFMLWCITHVVTYCMGRDVFFMLWCIACVVIYFVRHDFTCVVPYFICYDFTWVVTYFVCHDFICIVMSLVHMLGRFLCIDRRVQGFMVLWAHCEWWGTHLWAHQRLSQASPTNYTFLHSPVVWAPHARQLTSHLLCGACIRTTLYMYSPVCNALMGATDASVSCRIWRWHVWYICHIYVIRFHSLYGILLVAHKLTHLHFSGT